MKSLRSTVSRSFALALAALPLIACSADESIDELEVDDAAEGDESKADLAGGTFTYYYVTPDYRRCAAPYCGGVFYRLANASKTRCFDGTRAERCYAASIDWSRTGLGEVGMQKVTEALNRIGGDGVLVRAVVGSKDWGAGRRFAHFRPSEAWLAQGPNDAAGPVAKIEDSGVRCITYPCPSFREKKLNSGVTVNIADVRWTDSGATDEQVGNALDKMHTTGLIVAGYRYTVTGPGGRAPGRSVIQFYLRADDEPAQKTCYRGGCSGQICSDQPGVISTCEWRAEYACYRDATCEVQADGQCGWTPTTELQACLASPPPL